ncbi:MAG: thiamine-phosphate kinase [Brevinematales bacterium]|nr:thiamine-phosphate kinase [Brevinematales bacterium]
MKVDEFTLIEYIKEITDSYGIPKDVIVPNGDDCFGFVNKEGISIMTTDTVIDGIHFLKEKFSPYDIGIKSAIANISDIASMGGIPKYALVSLIIPQYFDLDFILDLYRGMVQVFIGQSVYIGGGNISKGRDLTISITIFGEVDKKPLTRSNAKPGDRIFVSGFVGDSSLGLEILLKQGKGPQLSEIESYLVSRHVLPPIRVELGLRIRNIATSCIDISDGLIQDISHIMKASKVGAKISLEKIPTSEQYSIYISREKRYNSLVDFFKYPLSGGEDYELIFTVPPNKVEEIGKISSELSIPLSEIGEITESNELELFYFNEKIDKVRYQGWKHF